LAEGGRHELPKVEEMQSHTLPVRHEEPMKRKETIKPKDI